MIKVIILGGGNVATHLAHVFIEASKVRLVQIYNRNITAIEELKKHTAITDNIQKIKKADIYLISVSDSAIDLVASKLKAANALVVHTSGSTSISVLKKHKHKGVFYPLQTFSKNRKIDFTNIPLCLEATDSKDLLLLEQLALQISKTYYTIDSKHRKKLHTAAVFINNFVNHLYFIGGEICKTNQIEPDILNPLLKETAEKALAITPYNAQTGPARRGDQSTIAKHLKDLSPNQQEIYKLLSQSIAKTYGKKL